MTINNMLINQELEIEPFNTSMDVKINMIAGGALVLWVVFTLSCVVAYS